MGLEGHLVAGRECGPCNVCCVALAIDDPVLRKVPGYPCQHTQHHGGCAIYAGRPATCRTFYCGWRVLRWVPQGLRPDTSDVLVGVLQDEGAAEGMGYTVSFMLLGPAGLRAEGLAEAVASSVAAGLPTQLVVPGPPGRTSAQTPINELLLEVVRSRDKAGLLDLLSEAYRLGQEMPSAEVLLVNPGD